MKYCSKCGKEIMDDAVICPHCGCAVEENGKSSSASGLPTQNGEYKATGKKIFAVVAVIVGALVGWGIANLILKFMF